LRVEIIGGAEAEKAFVDLVARFPKAAQRGVMKGAHIVSASSKDEMIRSKGIAYSSIKTRKTKYLALGAPVADRLTSRSGTLRASIRVVEDKASLSAFVGPTVKYGRIHEFGGAITTMALGRLAGARKHGRKFKLGGDWHQTYVDVKAHHRGSYTINMPARPYLWPAFLKHKADVRQAIVAELTDVFGRLRR
jgi:phage gpG-like protein